MDHGIPIDMEPSLSRRGVWETERVVHVGSWVTDTNTQVVDLREAVMKALKPFV